jgi:hypothetical protein
VPRRRWEDNIKTVVREIEWGDMEWIHPNQDKDSWRVLMNTVVNLSLP